LHDINVCGFYLINIWVRVEQNRAVNEGLDGASIPQPDDDQPILILSCIRLFVRNIFVVFEARE